MFKKRERRKEQRLNQQRPIWLAEGYKKTFSQGRMVDVSSWGTVFTCNGGKDCPKVGQQITSWFSVPYRSLDGSSHTASFTRIGHVRRIDEVDRTLHRIVMQFAEPLPFKPGEHKLIEFENELKQ